MVLLGQLYNIAEGFGRWNKEFITFWVIQEVPVVKQKLNYKEPSTEKHINEEKHLSYYKISNTNWPNFKKIHEF
jgi:hypothetical protein